MTAEVAIVNRFGIALAADSAVTIGEKRVWKSTNKLFSLGPNSDIAIMIYGGGDFVGAPWEIIIKTFREENCKRRFDYVEDCANIFREFLTRPEWNSALEEPLSFAGIFVKEIEELNNTIDCKKSSDFRKELEEWIQTCTDQILSKDIFDDSLSIKEFVALYGGYISKFARDIFGRHIPKNLLDKLTGYLFEYIRRSGCESDYQTGVVFAGYGVKEFYPVVRELIVDGKCNNFLRAWTGRVTDLNVHPRTLATVIPFAQRDMANVFMEGISSSYIAFFFKAISGILDRKSKYLIDNFVSGSSEKLVENAIQARENEGIMSDLGHAFERWRFETAINPLMESIRNLPREEMAAMAEALVELTSLRRKIDSNVQSVAGPVDVAFISKGDGLVWMKRKLYFDGKINGDFFARRKMRYGA